MGGMAAQGDALLIFRQNFLAGQQIAAFEIVRNVGGNKYLDFERLFANPGIAIFSSSSRMSLSGVKVSLRISSHCTRLKENDFKRFSSVACKYHMFFLLITL